VIFNAQIVLYLCTNRFADYKSIYFLFHDIIYLSDYYCFETAKKAFDSTVRILFFISPSI
jgi:hypothetical protein